MAFRPVAPRRVGLALLLLALVGASPAPVAQDAPQPQPAAARRRRRPARKPAAGAAATRATPAAAEQHRLPPDSTTKHTLALPGRTLNFTATAGSIRLFDDKGEPQADIAYTAYQLDGADARTRPVTFLFNGGPGAASAWLQFGAAGPWRLPINADAVTSSASPDLLPNAETWLDFTDLVFIDPVGTGYSRFVATGDDVRKRFFSVDGDVNSIALMIRRWLEKSDRLLSPKFVAGESYGGIRGPKIVRNLQVDQGVGVRGLILVSPLFDFREFTGSSLLQYVWSLPSMAAVARQAKGPVTLTPTSPRSSAMRAANSWPICMKGAADVEATTRLADKVAALDRDRPGGEPPARRAFWRRRISPRIRPPQRQGDRTLRRLGLRLRSLSGFERRSFRRSLRRSLDRAADQRGGRPHHAQAELAAGRLLRIAQRRGRAGAGISAAASIRRSRSPSCARSSRSIRS